VKTQAPLPAYASSPQNTARHPPARPFQVASRHGRRPAAYALLFLMSVRLPHGGLLPIGTVLALFYFGSSYRALRPFKGTGSLVAATAAASYVGLILALLVPPFAGSQGSVAETAKVVMWITQIPLLSVTAAYALCQISLRRGLMVYALGALVGGILNTPALLGEGNAVAWKYLVGYPASTLVLAGLAPISARLVTSLGVLLAGITFAAHARSLAFVLVLATVTNLLIRRKPVQETVLPLVMKVLVIATACALLLMTAMANGWLGSSLQTRYREETSGGRNLVIGGRAEISATMELARLRPEGFGVGVLPSSSFQNQAVNAVAAAGGFTGDYYSDVVFHGRVDLHSGISNMWYHFGVGGLALAAVCLAVLLRGTVHVMTWDRALQPAALLVIWYGLWALLASPINGFPYISGALAVCIAATARMSGRGV
jgi:hypothetical protein